MNTLDLEIPNSNSSISTIESYTRDVSDKNVINFLREHQEDFDTLPFTAVDSLILSTLIYLNMEEYSFDDLYGSQTVPLFDIMRFTPLAVLVKRSWMKHVDNIDEFLMAVACSRRYKDLSVKFFFNEYSDVVEKQFCAVTFQVTDKIFYVAYRGTDGTFTGWKEDFNLSYRDVIPSQVTALRYLSGVLSALPADALVYVGGHSKGGNLAEYAALTIDDEQFSRILRVFNHDGPSFLHSPSPRIKTKAFQDKLHKTVPESSIFGMILEKRDNYRVVQSTASFFNQHMPLTWIVDDADFLYQESLNKSALFFDETLDVWLEDSTPKQREYFIDTFYDLFTSTPANNWKEFQEGLLRNTKLLLQHGNELDDETKEMLAYTIKNLGSQASRYALDKFSASISSKINQVARNYEDRYVEKD